MLHTNSFYHYHYTPGFISLIFPSLTIYHSVGLVQHHHQRYQGHKIIKVLSPCQVLSGKLLGRRQVPRYVRALCFNSQKVMHELMQCWCVRFSVVKKWVVIKFYSWNLTWFSFRSACGFWIMITVLIIILASLVGNIVKCTKLPCHSQNSSAMLAPQVTTTASCHFARHITDSSHKNVLQF